MLNINSNFKKLSLADKKIKRPDNKLLNLSRENSSKKLVSKLKTDTMYSKSFLINNTFDIKETSSNRISSKNKKEFECFIDLSTKDKAMTSRQISKEEDITKNVIDSNIGKNLNLIEHSLNRIKNALIENLSKKKFETMINNSNENTKISKNPQEFRPLTNQFKEEVLKELRGKSEERIEIYQNFLKEIKVHISEISNFKTTESHCEKRILLTCASENKIVQNTKFNLFKRNSFINNKYLKTQNSYRGDISKTIYHTSKMNTNANSPKKNLSSNNMNVMNTNYQSTHTNGNNLITDYHSKNLLSKENSRSKFKPPNSNIIPKIDENYYEKLKSNIKQYYKFKKKNLSIQNKNNIIFMMSQPSKKKLHVSKKRKNKSVIHSKKKKFMKDSFYDIKADEVSDILKLPHIHYKSNDLKNLEVLSYRRSFLSEEKKDSSRIEQNIINLSTINEKDNALCSEMKEKMIINCKYV